MIIHATARPVRPDGFRTAPAGRRAGFSLTELLIAIGVLGIGLGMIAALFVTGLAQVRMSLADSEGGMVAGNGIAVARMFVTTGDVAGNELTVIADENNTTVINAAFQKYPYDHATTNKGFVILARQAGGGACQLVSVAYAKSAAGTVSAEILTTNATVYNNETEITFTLAGYLHVGAPVIVAATGEYATIVSISGFTATLDHGLTIGSSATAYTVVEEFAGSPVTGVCVTRTGLRP